MPNQTNYSINHQDNRLNDVRDPNNSINSRTNTKKYYNGYSGVNTDKNSNTDNRINITLNSNINNQNSTKEGGNKYNKINTGNNTSINNRENIDKDSGTSNNFRNNTYKLIFKGIKLWN